MPQCATLTKIFIRVLNSVGVFPCALLSELFTCTYLLFTEDPVNPSLDHVTLGMVGDISPYITTIAIYIYIYYTSSGTPAI